MQHGSTCSFVQQKNMKNVSDLLEFLFFLLPLGGFELEAQNIERGFTHWHKFRH
jgi:hypothetical protein